MRPFVGCQMPFVTAGLMVKPFVPSPLWEPLDRPRAPSAILDVVLSYRHLTTGISSSTALLTDNTGTLGILFRRPHLQLLAIAACLERSGCTFRTRSEAEVVLHLYQQQEETWLTELDGVFAFALWDGRRKQLVLVRDRLGAKPLYYAENGPLLAFASEVKALTAVGVVRAEAHPQALAEYFTFQNTYGRVTLFRGVNIVLPGTMIVVESDRLTERRWFDLRVFRNEVSLLDMGEMPMRTRQVVARDDRGTS